MSSVPELTGDFKIGVAPKAPKSAADPFDFGNQKEMFLQMLVAQLKNQDPTAPMDQKDMMNQMSQLSSVEQMTNMSEALQSLTTNATMTQGVALIGKHIDYANEDGSATFDQEVTSVRVAGGVPVLELADGNETALGTVVRVR
jgi:flagellar basal-body rod modification protein FlgD